MARTQTRQLKLLDVLLSAGIQTADPALRSWVASHVRAAVQDREGCRATVELRCLGCGRVQHKRVRCGPGCEACRNKGTSRARVAARIAATMPQVATRHMVVSFSPSVARALSQGRLCAREVQAIFQRVVFGAIAARLGRRKLGFGAVSIVHPFGNDLRLAPHLHALVLDGAFVRTPKGVRFLSLEPSFDTHEMATIAAEIGRRLEAAISMVSKSASSPTINRLRGAALRPPKQPRPESKPHSDHQDPSRSQGVRVYSSKRIAANDHHGRRRVLEYFGRSLLDPGKLELQADGKLRVELSRPSADGAQMIEIPPAELARRVAALGSVAEPGAIRQHGLMVRRTAKRWGLGGQQLELPSLSSQRSREQSPKQPQPEPALQKCTHCGGRLVAKAAEELA